MLLSKYSKFSKYHWIKEFLLPLTFVLILSSCDVQNIFTVPTKTPIPVSPPKQIGANSLHLRELWRRPGAILDGPQIVIVNNQIILASWEDGYKIVVLDAQSGDPIWKSEEIRNLGSLYADKERIYTGAIKDVQAYDLQTGNFLWNGAEQPAFKRGWLAVYSKGEQLEAYDFVEGQLYVMDAYNGKILGVIQWPAIFFRWKDINYSRSCGLETCFLTARNKSENKILWNYEFKERPKVWPIFIDDVMYVGTSDTIVALDTSTGEVYWETNDKYVTNIALGDNLIYSIRDDATIVGLEYQTGEIVGTVEMNPSRTYQDDVELGHNTDYFIAASDEFVVAYYGNSRELIVFEKDSKTK